MNLKTGSILFEKRADNIIIPASTTKVATILYALHRLKESELEKKVVADPAILKKVSRHYKFSHLNELPPYILQTDGTTFHILPYEELSLRSLLYGLLLSSGNDAANVIAHYIGGGSVEKFVEGMNEYVRSIGCSHTHFKNPHGLHVPGQVSTSREMALIAKEALKYPLVREIVKTSEYLRPSTNLQNAMTMRQGNRLVTEGKLHLDEAFGMKTGYTSDGGYCLLACAFDGKRALVASLYNSQEQNDRYHDAIEMFTKAFEEKPESRRLFNSEDVFVISLSEKCKVKVRLERPVEWEEFASEKPKLTTQLSPFVTDAMVIKKGEHIANLLLFANDTYSESFPLYATEEMRPPLLKLYKKQLVWFSLALLMVLSWMVATARKASRRQPGVTRRDA